MLRAKVLRDVFLAKTAVSWKTLSNSTDGFIGIFWSCILCGKLNRSTSQFSRETMPCRKCKSTWRARAVALAVLHGLGYESKKFQAIAPDWSRIGLGISDDITLSSKLSTKFSYSNSYFDTYPYLDIREIPFRAKNQFEFVVCSDVLEHIDIDLPSAISGLRSLLKVNGFLVASVPIIKDAKHKDFYPSMQTFTIIDDSVHWTDGQGGGHIDHNPEFHGGRGQNLAFRQFSNESFSSALNQAGFKEIVLARFERTLGVPVIDSPGIFIARG